MDLKGKVALITGGGGGIGAAITKRFVADGAKVCITGRRKAVLDEFAQSLPPGSVTVCSGDVSQHEDIKRMVETTVAFGGKIDVVVNNAGISQQGSVVDLDPELWRHVFEVNVTGPFLIMKEVIPHMIKNGGGSIISISSIGGLRCRAGKPAYEASKAALNMLTQQVALEFGPQKIRCNAVCPGPVITEMWDKSFSAITKALGTDREGVLAIMARDMPVRRVAEPHEISGICSYLASDESLFMTGAVIPIDGGACIVDASGVSIAAALAEKMK